MLLLEMINTSGATATSATYSIRSPFNGLTTADTGMLQVSIETAGTVVLEGRMAAEYPWAPIHTVTASDMAEVPLTPQMRATLAGGSGSILVGLLIPRS